MVIGCEIEFRTNMVGNTCSRFVWNAIRSIFARRDEDGKQFSICPKLFTLDFPQVFHISSNQSSLLGRGKFPPERERSLLTEELSSYLPCELSSPGETFQNCFRLRTSIHPAARIDKVAKNKKKVHPSLCTNPTFYTNPSLCTNPTFYLHPPGEPWMAYGTRRRCSVRSVSPLQLFAAPLAPHHHHQTSRPSSCPGSA